MMAHSAPSPIDLLVAARKIADFADAEGVGASRSAARVQYDHLGAVLADSVLQAGLRYASVVRPRVERILVNYPDSANACALAEIVRKGQAAEFLDWQHPIKAARFERTVEFICNSGIEHVADLREQLRNDEFCLDLQCINGIGPKTVDYMACLVGIESIAVDRHIRSFARQVGIQAADYVFLKRVFCFAADLLSISRREFDAWVWQRESSKRSSQLSLAF
ncbi:hypothetical protein [Bosea vestrisii]|uniref:Uncharacterized protein n=1 Tax=Bosea vestrisii TaxID=151416 RepID=A0ABW0H3F8_9HYPH